jgi:UrcA family protein
MSTSNTKLTTFGGTMACLALFAASAVTTTALAASPADSSPTVRVRYDDLNLSSEQGNQVLYRRIVKAAEEVCPGTHARDLDTRAAAERCQAAAIAKAVGEVNSPQLAMLHASRVSHG